MPDVSVLEVFLHDRSIGTITLVQGLRSLFAFNEDYIADRNRQTLSLSFKDDFGDLITDEPRVTRVVPPFFSNLLPEGPLRDYLAKRASVNAAREFFLLWILGADLPGAVSVRPAKGQELPPEVEEAFADESASSGFRFSLAGVQLKFSALKNRGRSGGLTIPAHGVGGHWIVKLPSTQYAGMLENEYAMMTLSAVFWYLQEQAIYTMPFMNRVGVVFLLSLAGAVLVSLVAPAKTEVSVVTLQGVSYKTSTGFNIAGVGVILILIALYATWW